MTPCKPSRRSGIPGDGCVSKRVWKQLHLVSANSNHPSADVNALSDRAGRTYEYAGGWNTAKRGNHSQAREKTPIVYIFVLTKRKLGVSTSCP